MKHFRFYKGVACLLLCIPTCANACGTEIFVSQNGNDSTADGSSAKPFATLAAAKNFAETSLKNDEIITYNFSDGIFIFDNTVVFESIGNSNAKIEIKGSGNTFFCGSLRIGLDRLKEVDNKSILEKMPKQRKAKIYSLDLRELGISDLGSLRQRGFGTPRDVPEIEAFIKGENLRLARYPNSELMRIGKIIDAGQVKVLTHRGMDKPSTDKNVRGAIFEFIDPRHKRWINADDAFACGNFSVGWADDEIKIKKIDCKKNTVELSSPHIYGVMSCLPDPANPRSKQDLSTRGYFVKNLIEELDAHGEYFIDRNSGIFYIALDSLDKKAFLEFTTRSNPLIAFKNFDGATIKNVKFGGSRGMGIYINSAKNIKIESCEFSNFGTVAISAHNLFQKNPTPSLANHKPRFPFNSAISISNCIIHDNGLGGIYIRGGDKRNLLPSGNLVFNCEFYRNSRANLKYTPSLSIYDVGARVANCLFRDDPFNTMQFGGNDLIIEQNRFERICYNISDMGVIYTGRNPSDKGNIIRRNFFSECLAQNRNCTIRGVYIDDGSGGYDISENIFCRIRCAEPNAANQGIAAIYFHGGHDNTVYKNVFIDCGVGAFHSQWDDSWWRQNLDSPDWQYKLKKLVDIESNEYQKKYPLLKNFFKNDRLRVNYITQNLYYRTSGALNGNYVYKWNDFLNPSQNIPQDKKNWTPQDVQKYFGDNGIVKSILSTPFYKSQ